MKRFLIVYAAILLASGGTYAGVERSLDGGEPIEWSSERTAPAAKTLRGVIVQKGATGKPELLSVQMKHSRAGVELIAYASQDGGMTWAAKGLVASDPDPNTDLGDTSLLLVNDGSVLCSYRHNHIHGLPTSEKYFSIRVAISTDRGDTWRLHSVVAQHRGYDFGLWSNWLIQLSNGDIQCYYDDEMTPFLDGTGAWHQFWVLKTLSGTSWENLVIASKAHTPGDLSRDGCGMVVEVRPGRLVSVLESVHTEMPRYGCVRMVSSDDYGSTWSWREREREIIYGEPWYQSFAPCFLGIGGDRYLCVVMSDEHLGRDARAPLKPSTLQCKNLYILGTSNGTDIDWEYPGRFMSGEESLWSSGCMLNSNQVYIQYHHPIGVPANKLGTIVGVD